MTTEILRLNLGFVNAYLLQGERGFVLVDTGLEFQRAKLVSEMRRNGAQPDALQLVILTHGDADHSGNCAWLQKEFGLRIAVHPGDRALVETGLQPERAAGTLVHGLFSALGRLGTRLRGSRPPAFRTFRPDLELADGQDLAPYGLDARVLHIPGHTKGSIAILTGDGRLIAGDTFANMFGSHGAPYVQDRGELAASIRRLQQLDARTILPGHGRPFPFRAIRGLRV
jgi:hydroxyacylglutathione hydrolase